MLEVENCYVLMTSMQKAWEIDFLRALQAAQPNGLGQILEARGFNSMSFKH
jgi:hypothetical protein